MHDSVLNQVLNQVLSALRFRAAPESFTDDEATRPVIFSIKVWSEQN